MPINDSQKQKVADAVHTAFSSPPSPDKLVEWLLACADGWLQKLNNPDRVQQATRQEVVAAAIAAAYGPRDFGPIADNDFGNLLKAITRSDELKPWEAPSWRNQPLITAIDRALAYSVLLPLPPQGGLAPGTSPWEQQWPGSWTVLLPRITRALTPQEIDGVGRAIHDWHQNTWLTELPAKKRNLLRYAWRSPVALAVLLPSWVDDFIATGVGNGAPPDRYEVALAHAVWCFGDLGASSLPWDLWEDAKKHFSAFDPKGTPHVIFEPSDVRAVGAVIAFGLIGREEGWPAAWTALEQEIKSALWRPRPPLRPINEIHVHVLHGTTDEVEQDAESMADLFGPAFARRPFTQHLNERADDLRVRSNDTLEWVVNRVDLRRFDRTERSLREFVTEAIAPVPLCKTNEFRKTPLAFAMDKLMAAKVVRCQVDGCPGTIGLEDCCGKCQRPSIGDLLVESVDNSWWIYERDHGSLVQCRRCQNCKGLFVRTDRACPNCSEDDWSPANRGIEVWVEVDHVLLPVWYRARARPCKTAEVSGKHRLQGVIVTIQAWNDGPEKMLLLGWLEGRNNLWKVGDDLRQKGLFTEVLPIFGKAMLQLCEDELDAQPHWNQFDNWFSALMTSIVL